MIINARNVNDAYRQGIEFFLPQVDLGLPTMASRAGEVLEATGPVVTSYAFPCERVLWDAQRDCNPFFHLAESLWMLAGKNDVDTLVRFNKKMGDFSDDGIVFHGAYGARWRHWWSIDQLQTCIAMLRKDPMTRRCVMTMWSPEDDLDAPDGCKDVPCNLIVKFEARRGLLDMQVFCRSNDMIWGAYGANAVHYAFLQEYVALMVGIPVGTYWQISANFHVYLAIWKEKVRMDGTVDSDFYNGKGPGPKPMPLLTNLETDIGDADLRYRFEACLAGQRTGIDFLDLVCLPLLNNVWDAWKEGDRGKSILLAQHIPFQDNDWVMACLMWMERRALK